MAPVVPLAFGILATGITLAGVLALLFAVAAFVGVARDDRLSGTAKVMWFSDRRAASDLRIGRVLRRSQRLVRRASGRDDVVDTA
jgi:hypothetical protein